MAPVSRAATKTLEDVSLEINSRFDKLEKTLSDVLKENAVLKETNKRLETEMLGMRNHMNTLEQYQRNWSVRINNLELPEDVASDPYKTRDYVFDKAFKPIFRGAIEKGDIAGMPTAQNTIEIAHVLPGQTGKAKPIIARFLYRNDRATILKNKREFTPRSGGNRGKPDYTIFEDLTRDSFSLLKRLLADDRVEAAWSLRGQLKYKLVGSGEIRKIDNIYLPFGSHFNT